MVGASDYLALHARLSPNAPAVQDLTSDRSWTYREFDQSVARWAQLLRQRGVARGERVAAFAKNRAELIFLHLACARIGAIYVPLNWRLSTAEIAAIVASAAPRIILCDQSLSEHPPAADSLEAFAGDALGVEPLPLQNNDSDEPSLILYTSGTSGSPKGVLLSERNIWKTGLNFSIVARITHESAMLCDTPMFHVIGLITNIRPIMMRGGRIVLSDGFQASRTLSRLADSRLGITHYFCVPQMAALLRADPRFDPQSLRGLTGIFSGGGPHAADAIRAWTRHGIPMADGFGMSEAGTVSCMPLDVEQIDAHAGSAGIIAPGVEVRIVDAKGQDCANGAAGELWVRGENVTSGYWGLPGDTASGIDPEGWLRSGDIAKLDAEGFLWLIDRKKDMFISGGENIFPAEIEAALAAHPSIMECAVIGVADAQWGEVGHLFVVHSAVGGLELRDIEAYLAGKLARYKIPKIMSVIEALPRNGAGKVLKNALRTSVFQGRLIIPTGTVAER
jgi:fatty-acyl-CoA synthase